MRSNGVKCGHGITSVAVYMYKLMVTDDEENMSMYRGRQCRRDTLDHKNVQEQVTWAAPNKHADHVICSCDVRNEFDSNGFYVKTPTHIPEIFHKAAILTVVKIEFL